MPSSGAQTKEVVCSQRGHLCHTHELKVKVLDSTLKRSSCAPCVFTLLCPKIKAPFQPLTLFELNPDTRIVLNLSDHLAVPANDDSNSKSGHNHLDGMCLKMTTKVIRIIFKEREGHHLHQECFHPSWIQSLLGQP